MLPQLSRVEPAELQLISQDPRVHPVLRRQPVQVHPLQVSQPVPAPPGQLVVILSGADRQPPVVGMLTQQGGQLGRRSSMPSTVDRASAAKPSSASDMSRL